MYKAACLGLLLFAGAPASAATDDGVVLGSRPGVTFGGRGAYMKPKDGWLSSYRSQDAAHPLGRDIDDSGYMITGALNFHF